MIDDDVSTMLNSDDPHNQRKFFKGFYTEHDNDKANLRFKYCHPREVTMKRQKKLMFKAQFFQKVSHLKDLGKKNELMQKTARWLDNNIKDLSPGRRDKSVNQYQKNLDKLHFQMLQYAERKIDDKFMRKRLKDLVEQKAIVDPKTNY
jgi:hypothetical protein